MASTIIITLTGGNEMPVDKFEMDDDSGSSCPLATKDPEVNEENQQVAVEDASYRDPSDDGGFRVSEVCGNCKAYDQTEEMLECIGDESGDLGYCQIFKFVCESYYTCDKWVKGGPVTSDVQKDYKDIL